MAGGGFGAVIAVRRAQQAAYNAALAASAAGASENISAYFVATGKYPSNTQIWFAGKNSTGDFDPATLDKIGFGNTPAPKGHFILEAFNRDYAGVSGITNPDFVALKETDTTRPSCCEAAFGRIWYSGTQDIATQGIVYFSAVINSTADLERCYQQNDPTSEQLSDLLDTDGGAIQINNCGKVVALREYRSGMLVFATNGVWYIRAGSDTGFSATNYVVERITDIGALGRGSVVSAEGSVMYWSDAGIYQITPDQFGTLFSTSVSEFTIQSFYNDISDIAKKFAVGKYLSREKKIIWIYKNDNSVVTADTQRNSYLEYDVNLKAFFPGQFTDGTDVVVVSLFQKGYFGTTTVDEAVTLDGLNVTLDGINVTLPVEVDASQTSSIKFVGLRFGAFSGGGGDGEPVVDYYGATFFELTNTDYIDPNGALSAYAETNNINLGELMREKSAPYLYAYFNRTEQGYELDGDGNIVFDQPSSCLMRAKWDWTGTGSAGKWSNPQQIYRFKRLYVPTSVTDPFDYDYEVINTKTLVRGHGKSVRFRFENEPNKGFELIGWAIPMTVGV